MRPIGSFLWLIFKTPSRLLNPINAGRQWGAAADQSQQPQLFTLMTSCQFIFYIKLLFVFPGRRYFPCKSLLFCLNALFKCNTSQSKQQMTLIAFIYISHLEIWHTLKCPIQTLRIHRAAWVSIIKTAKRPQCDGDADASQGFSERFLLHNQGPQADNNNWLQAGKVADCGSSSTSNMWWEKKKSQQKAALVCRNPKSAEKRKTCVVLFCAPLLINALIVF